MNERIKELARQAGVDFGSVTQDYFGEWFPAITSTEKIDFEKFAELIVKECAVLINDERRAFNPTEWDQGADWGHKNAVDAITKHFGVEE